MLGELEGHGAKFLDNGVPKDVFDVFEAYGVNAIRLRVWNDPYDENRNPYGGGTNDFETTIGLAERAIKHGMTFLLDFHYSDFWTDPAKQFKPKEWQNLSGAELEKAVYGYTYKSLAELRHRGLMPEMVQIGNELTNGFLWPDGKPPDYEGMFRLLSQGISAVRDIDRNIKIVIHIDNGGRNDLYRDWFDHAAEAGLDFDIIGMSYYPYWHGTLDELDFNMNDISERYKKDVVIVETAYGFTTDNHGENMIFTEELSANASYSPTEEGQRKFLLELADRIKRVRNNRGKGFFYWEPAWVPMKGVTWATKAGRDYIGDPASGGNTWSNQALFDFNGNALPALKAIKDL